MPARLRRPSRAGCWNGRTIWKVNSALRVDVKLVTRSESLQAIRSAGSCCPTESSRTTGELLLLLTISRSTSYPLQFGVLDDFMMCLCNIQSSSKAIFSKLLFISQSLTQTQKLLLFSYQSSTFSSVYISWISFDFAKFHQKTSLDVSFTNRFSVGLIACALPIHTFLRLFLVLFCCI